jgi:4a-hydroxytetrahydrobiopterin dehydratase
MSELVARSCIPCKGGVAPLKGEEIKPLISQLEGWSVVDEHHLVKTYKFSDFVGALRFVNRLGEIAEKEWHHPDLHLARESKSGNLTQNQRTDGERFVFALGRSWQLDAKS